MKPSRLLKLKFPADPRYLQRVRDEVRNACARGGCADELVRQIVLAVNEACANVIRHAYKGSNAGEIILEIFNNGRELEFHLRDFADPVDLTSIGPRDPREIKPGGLGTLFIREIMDECAYGHVQGKRGNFLHMKKKIG
jgi:sigma-B regulation protein RsbU (phosphoserine phosphatase)